MIAVAPHRVVVDDAAGLGNRLGWNGKVGRAEVVLRTPPNAPRPVGLKATSAMPSCLQVSSTPSSTLRVHSEYSGWTAAIG